MKKGRCGFNNYMKRASAFFAVFLAVTSGLSLTGCANPGEKIKDYLQANNILDPDKYEKDGADEPGENGHESSSELGKSGQESGEAGSKGSGEGAEAASTAESESSADNEKGSGESDSSAEGETTEPSAGDSSSEASTFDADVVNKAIDDLITQIEEETGRTGRREEKTEEENSAGKDATTFFSDSYQNNQRLAIGLDDESIPLLMEDQKGMYAFEHLNEEGKRLYVELLTIITNRAEDIVVSTLDEEVLDVVCQFVLADHPEIFYMDGYTYTRYTIAGELKKISFTGNYIYRGEELEQRKQKIDEYTQRCLSQMPEGLDDYGKVKYVYDYLISNTDYDSNAKDNQNICSVFLYGKSVCQGYAKATQYLLNRIGIPATLVTGKINGVGHAWNLVFVDGEYTYVDTTWGDSSYQKLESGSTDAEKLPLINYMYLCCTTQDISRTHTIAETLPMPKCTSMKNNYFVKENEYFTTADLDAVGELFKRRYADGSNNVTIKCSTQAVYQEFIDKLLTNQQVFGYIEGSNNTVSYTTFDDQYILIIWLY